LQVIIGIVQFLIIPVLIIMIIQQQKVNVVSVFWVFKRIEIF